jgi:hypothetical protein
MNQALIRGGERILIYSGLVVALALGAGWREYSPAEAQPAQTAALRIATVDILGVAEKLVSSEKYRAGRETNAASLAKPLQAMVDELTELETRYNALAADSPERQATQTQFQQKNRVFQQASQQAKIDDERFKAVQVAECYRIVLEAADALGGELGYTVVLATRSGQPTIRSDNVPGAVQEMLARPVVRGTVADDLTERLSKRLALDAPEPVRAQPVPETPPTAPK